LQTAVHPTEVRTAFKSSDGLANQLESSKGEKTEWAQNSKHLMNFEIDICFRPVAITTKLFAMPIKEVVQCNQS
jgi:hypothetical protein